MSWYLQVIKNYVNFSGRARRKEYWMFFLFTSIFEILAIILDNILGLTFHLAGVYQYFGTIYLIYLLLVLIPGIALVVRRLHDQDKSGAWFFIALVPFIGGIWRLVLMCIEGTYGPNQYGEDPKDRGYRPSINRTPSVSAPERSELNSTFRITTPNSTFRIAGLKLSKIEADKGEAIEAKITYQNNGDEIKEYMLTLYVNGAEMNKQHVDIPPYTQGSVVMQVPPISENGEYTIRVGSCSQKLMIGYIDRKPTVSASAPAPARTEPKSTFRIAGLKLSKIEADRGEAIEARVTYQNNGDEIKEYMLTLYVNDVEMHKQPIDIPPYTQGSVAMQVPPISEIGEYTIKVGNCSQKLTILNQHDENYLVDAPIVEAPFVYTPIIHSPERTMYKSDAINTITVTGLKLSKTQAACGEAVLAEISCQNSGDVIKEYMLTLYVNGIALQKQHIDIPPKSQSTVTMQVPPIWDIGKYTITVGNCSQKLMLQ